MNAGVGILLSNPNPFPFKKTKNKPLIRQKIDKILENLTAASQM